LKKIGKNVIGLDISKESKKFCSKYGIDVKLLNIENKRFPFKKNTFDAAIAFHFIEHIQDPDNFLKEVKRILKKNGIIILSTPNFRYAYKTFYSDFTHVKPYDHESIQRLLRTYGFEIVSIKKKFFPPFIWRLSERFFDFPIFPTSVLQKQSANLLVVARNK